MLASDVMKEAAVLLTDPQQMYWSDIVLLPLLNKANNELALLFEREELPILLEEQSPVTKVDPGDKIMDEIPTDMVEPIRMWERALGSQEKWAEVNQVINIDKNFTTSNRVAEWAWRRAQIFITPPTQSREVMLDYFRTIMPLDFAGSLVEVPKAKTWLAARTAQLACLHVGNNPTRYNELDPEVAKAEDVLLRTMGKRVQGAYGVRRRPYRGAMNRRSTVV
jgi:hypothetical protein